MNIDWSKAPEWAGAVVKNQGGELVWVPCFGVIGDGQWLGTGFTHRVDMCYPHCWELVQERPSEAAWNGEGLPPVGKDVCEYRGAHQWDVWTIVSIFAEWGEGSRRVVFVDFGDGWREERDAERFRPIRTPEQIAAEEREAKAKELYCAINWDDGESGWVRLLEARKDDYRKAIDEGWHKVPRA